MKILLLFSLWLHFVRGKLKEKLQMNHHYLRSGARQTECFVILDSFLPFYLPNNLESSKFWKNEKSIWRCHHFTHVYQKWKPWCMIPEIWRATERNFPHFWTIFCLFTPSNNVENQNFEKWKKAWRYYCFTQVYHKWKSYDVWIIRYEEWQT